jgi:hypothetical protein
VPAGNERDALLRFADRLCAELGYGEGGEEVPGARSPLAGNGDTTTGVLSPEDESLVATIRRSLAEVAAAIGAERPDGVPQRAVSAALDGAEMVMRGELARGNAAELASLIPGFVFLVALPMVEQDEALDLSRRASKLIEGTLGV